jgi:hypothetical protein
MNGKPVRGVRTPNERVALDLEGHAAEQDAGAQAHQTREGIFNGGIHGPNACLDGGCNGGHVCDPHKGDMGVPPASLAEFTLSAADGLDCYDVSLVEGYDLPGRPRSELPVSAQGSVQQQRLPRRLQERVPRRLEPDEQRGVLLGPV